jgi:hypothetical protein
MASIPTSHTDTCEVCGNPVRWHDHPPDAINPIGLWHHDEEALDDDHACVPQANAKRWNEQ